jgi:hypothetical protein
MPEPGPGPAPEPEPEPQPEPEPLPEPQPEPEPEAPPPLSEEPRPVRAFRSEPEVDYADTQSSFAHEPPFRPRRNPLRMYTIAAVLFALVAFAAIGAVAWYGVPNWAPLSRQTFAAAQPDLVLEFPPNRQDRRTLPSGAEFFGASGKVTNVGREKRNVPPILIVLRDSKDQIVYSWEVAPPKHQLAPGESVTINEAVTDIPKTAKVAEIGWKPS